MNPIALVQVGIQIKNLVSTNQKIKLDFGPSIRAASYETAQIIRDDLVDYPPPPTYPLAWRSEGQRKAYHAMRRRAGLPLKYTRISDPQSEKLGPSWFTEHYGVLGARTATRVSYAPKVQHFYTQEPMHAQTGWPTDVEVITKLMDKGIVGKLVVKHIMKRWG